MISRIDKRLLSIFLLALALRVSAGIAAGGPIDRGDAPRYESLAMNGGISAHQEPLYPLFLRAVYRIFGHHDYHALFVIQGIASSLVVLAAYALVRAMFDRRSAMIASLICAVYPNFILYNLAALPESLIVLLVASAMTVMAARMREAREACLEGALAGFGILLLPSLVFLTSGLLIVSRRRLLFLLAFAVIVAPWIIRNAIVFGTLVPVYGASSFNITLDHFSGDWMSVAAAVYSRAALFFMGNWGAEILGRSQTGGALALYHVRNLGYLAVLLLGSIAMARYLKRAHARVVMPILGAVVLQLMITRVFDVRFRTLLEIPLIAYAGALLGRIRGTGASTRTRSERARSAAGTGT